MQSNNLETIYIMWLRDMKRFWRAKSRLVGTLMMPFFFLVAMGFGFSSGFNLPGAPPGVNYLNFLVPGILGMTMLFSSMSAGISVLWDKEFGFLKEMMVAPVKRWAIVLGRIVGGVTTALIQGVLILILSLFLGFKVVNLSGFIWALLFMLLIGIGFIGFGVAIASKMEDTQGFSLIMQFVVFPIFLLSGAFFPVTNFPGWLRPIALIDPLTYGVDGLRASLIGFSQFPLFLDFAILLIFGGLMVILGSWFFSKTEV
jgi:ABC-2 type transport system permease protein